LIALAAFLVSRVSDEPQTRGRWRVLGITWGFAGAAVWLAGSYLLNERFGFHLAILATLALLILLKAMFRLPAAATLAANTLILMLVMVPAADYVLRPNYDLNPQLDDARRLYSYEVARKDPSAFAAWWRNYVQQFHKMMAELGSSGVTLHENSMLAPYSHATFFRSHIKINNRGFRGPDVAEVKGSAYRIVALGESTTFGATINAEDKPWPEVLEQIIREHLKPVRPVEVINAGISAITLPDNLSRLPLEILPLKPDMIISYHGINGFNLLDPAMPRIYGYRQPDYRPRPLKLLADAEYAVKMKRFRRSLLPSAKAPLGDVTPLNTDYARAYRALIEAARTNEIKLVIANFSMAVNAGSDADVITFFRAGFPSVHWQIQANRLHSDIVQQLAQAHPDVRMVDTQPALDGEHSKFIDLVHFTQEGRVQLAEDIFAGIQDLLEVELRAASGNETTSRQPQ
jgi:lysophospholipase L1-like esterase